MYERGVGLLDDAVLGALYKIDLKLAIEWSYEISYRMNCSVIRNC